MSAQDNFDLASLGELIPTSIAAFAGVQNNSHALKNGTRNGGSIEHEAACVIAKPSNTSTNNGHAADTPDFPSQDTFIAQRTLLAAAGKLTELVSSPSNRLLEVSSQYFEARALHIIADKRIPDKLSSASGGMLHISSLAELVGIESQKLSRVMRCLCTIHIFSEMEPYVFANNRISQALVNNEPLRAYILLFGLDIYSASDHLPRYLSDPVLGRSYSVHETPWQAALGTTKSRWEWLEEQVPVETLLSGGHDSNGDSTSGYPGPFGDELKGATISQLANDLVARPEHKIFGLAMLGGGRVFGQAHLYDFPWSSLGAATIVDVGGGVGGFCLQLAKLYPALKFVVQDRAPVLDQARTTVWPAELPQALSRVQFMPHHFFDPNPVKNADVYWLRYVIHDWSDEYCVRILAAIKSAMGPNSRILICDQVMNTTLGSKELQPAPAPLPANWGYYARYSHQRDLAMMSIINGIERTPEQFREIVEQAGLKLKKIWECRSQVSIVEVVL